MTAGPVGELLASDYIEATFPRYCYELKPSTLEVEDDHSRRAPYTACLPTQIERIHAGAFLAKKLLLVSVLHQL